MTIRGYIALIYAITATGVSVLADQGPFQCAPPLQAMALQISDPTIVSIGGFDPPTGHAELDDLPAYRTDDPWRRSDSQMLAAESGL